MRSIRLPRDRDNGKSKGYAFIEIADRSVAYEVKQKLNFEKILDNEIHAAIIGERNEDANVLITNLDIGVKGKDFDNFFMKW